VDSLRWLFIEAAGHRGSFFRPAKIGSCVFAALVSSEEGSIRNYSCFFFWPLCLLSSGGLRLMALELAVTKHPYDWFTAPAKIAQTSEVNGLA